MNNPSNPTKFKLAELVISVIALILGLVYLNTDWISTSVLLPIYAVFFTALPVLRLIEARKNGAKGLIAVLPSLFYLLIALVVIAATVIYFVQY